MTEEEKRRLIEEHLRTVRGLPTLEAPEISTPSQAEVMAQVAPESPAVEDMPALRQAETPEAVETAAEIPVTDVDSGSVPAAPEAAQLRRDVPQQPSEESRYQQAKDRSLLERGLGAGIAAVGSIFGASPDAIDYAVGRGQQTDAMKQYYADRDFREREEAKAVKARQEEVDTFRKRLGLQEQELQLALSDPQSAASRTYQQALTQMGVDPELAGQLTPNHPASSLALKLAERAHEAEMSDANRRAKFEDFVRQEQVKLSNRKEMAEFTGNTPESRLRRAFATAGKNVGGSKLSRSGAIDEARRVMMNQAVANFRLREGRAPTEDETGSLSQEVEATIALAGRKGLRSAATDKAKRLFGLGDKEAEAMVTTGGREEVKEAVRGRREDRKHFVPGYVRGEGAPELSNAEIKGVRETVSAMDRLRRLSRQMVSLSKKITPMEAQGARLGFYSNKMAQAMQIQKTLLTEMRKIQNTGVPQQFEIKMIEDQIPRLESMQGQLSTEKVYRNLEKTMRSSMESGLRAYGYERAPAKVYQLPSGRKLRVQAGQEAAFFAKYPEATEVK